MSHPRKPAIVTFSRRTDPAFFMDRFMECIRVGGCLVPNPFSGKPYFVGLTPDDVLILNFWTKSPLVVSQYVDRLRESGYPIALFISQTGYPRYLETGLPSPAETTEGVRRLSEKLGASCLWWRYDPIIVTRRLSPAWHVDNFSKLCTQVWRGATRRVIVSLAHIDGPYRAIRPALEQACADADDQLTMPDYRGFVLLATRLSQIAGESGIRLEVCCSPEIKAEDIRSVHQGTCLSSEYLQDIVPDLPALKHVPLRKGSGSLGYGPCRCLESRDIGTNGTCTHGCVYCYANRARTGLGGQSLRPIFSPASDT